MGGARRPGMAADEARVGGARRPEVGLLSLSVTIMGDAALCWWREDNCRLMPRDGGGCREEDCRSMPRDGGGGCREEDCRSTPREGGGRCRMGDSSEDLERVKRRIGGSSMMSCVSVVKRCTQSSCC